MLLITHLLIEIPLQASITVRGVVCKQYMCFFMKLVSSAVQLTLDKELLFHPQF